MKSYGYTTCNRFGNFQVEWEIESTFFTKLFKKPTIFKYYSLSKEMKHDKFKSKHAGMYYDWFDSEGKLVTDQKVLTKITETINMIFHTDYLFKG